MRCGRILVEGEAEDVISPKPRQRRRSHGKKSSSNPYSGVGLDKFASLNAELSAKREYVAKKTGTPESMLRFVYRRHGWVPVVVRQRHGGGVSSKPGTRTDQKMQRKENFGRSPNSKEAYHGSGDDVKVKSDHGEGQGSGGDGSEIREGSDVLSMLPWWSGYAKTTAFGVLTVSAIMVRKTAVPATAMAMVMVLGSLQKRWLGGVMCMKRFISSGISYFSELFEHWKKTPDVESGVPFSMPAVEVRSPDVESGLPVSMPAVEVRSPDVERMPKSLPALEIQHPLASPEHRMKINKRVPRGGPLLSLSAPCSPRQTGQANTAFSAPLKGLEISTQLDSKVSLHRKSLEISTQLENKVTVPTKSQEINAQLEKKISLPRKSQEINAQLESKVSVPRKSQEINAQQYAKMGNDKNKGKMVIEKNKKYGRILSLDSQLMNPTRLYKAESFMRKRKAGRKAIDATIGASVMIVILFFLIAYGRISAIFFTSASWYVLPNLRTGNSNKRAD